MIPAQLLDKFQSVEDEMLDAETMAKRKNILFNGINVFEE